MSPIAGTLAERYAAVRNLTEQLASPLSPEDQCIQSMDDVSPTKWHRAHTTWFFETFLLKPHMEGYQEADPLYAYLFNSYYEAAGPRHPRPSRGVISRPSAAEVGGYRAHVDEAMAGLLCGDLPAPVADLVELGLNHEQQHQELLLMDIKNVLSHNPTQPSYNPAAEESPVGAAPGAPAGWVRFEGGRRGLGHDGGSFAFDNESPRHEVLLGAYELSCRLVTCGQWLEFMADGGYRTPTLWLSDGWATVQSSRWEAPLYWSHDGAGEAAWSVFTLSGRRPVAADEPVCHLSYYEADAYARWAGARLPTEAEWESAAAMHASTGGANLLGTGALHPRACAAGGLVQMLGDVWEWTSSAYSAYPGFVPAAGAVGEYNGKFMVNQMVLRGGCCATPADHVRATYRNFFAPGTRWHFSGLRLARDSR